MSLYVVATPIGNLLDMTQRAIQVLADVDVIAAEDTRHSKSLLKHYGISTPLIAFHDHNERTGSQPLIARMLKGDQVALISDAGTPLISDPGYQLVRDAHAAAIQVIPIPGPTAMAAALSASGLATDSFLFVGFLPSKLSARVAKLQTLRYYPFSLVFYEAPHRIDKSVSSMIDVFGGQRKACIAREMTKTFEQIVNGTLDELLAGLLSREIVSKGEFVVIVSGVTDNNVEFDDRTLLTHLLAELPPSKAAALAHKLTGKPKKAFYELALVIKNE